MSRQLWWLFRAMCLPCQENQIFTLCMFFAVLFVVPFSIVCCCLRRGPQLWEAAPIVRADSVALDGRGSNISSNGVCGETLKVFHSCIDIEARYKQSKLRFYSYCRALALL